MKSSLENSQTLGLINVNLIILLKVYDITAHTRNVLYESNTVIRDCLIHQQNEIIQENVMKSEDYISNPEIHFPIPINEIEAFVHKL